MTYPKAEKKRQKNIDSRKAFAKRSQIFRESESIELYRYECGRLGVYKSKFFDEMTYIYLSHNNHLLFNTLGISAASLSIIFVLSSLILLVTTFMNGIVFFIPLIFTCLIASFSIWYTFFLFKCDSLDIGYENNGL